MTDDELLALAEERAANDKGKRVGLSQVVFDNDLGCRVRELRKSLGLSQQALAEQVAADGLRWHQQTVERVERGQRPVRASELASLSAALRTTSADLTNSSGQSATVPFTLDHLLGGTDGIHTLHDLLFTTGQRIREASGLVINELKRLQVENGDLREALDRLRPAHHEPYVDEEHQGGNCVDLVMTLVAERERAKPAHTFALIHQWCDEWQDQPALREVVDLLRAFVPARGGAAAGYAERTSGAQVAREQTTVRADQSVAALRSWCDQTDAWTECCPHGEDEPADCEVCTELRSGVRVLRRFLAGELS